LNASWTAACHVEPAELLGSICHPEPAELMCNSPAKVFPAKPRASCPAACHPQPAEPTGNSPGIHPVNPRASTWPCACGGRRGAPRDSVQAPTLGRGCARGAAARAGNPLAGGERPHSAPPLRLHGGQAAARADPAAEQSRGAWARRRARSAGAARDRAGTFAAGGAASARAVACGHGGGAGRRPLEFMVLGARGGGALRAPAAAALLGRAMALSC